jgi:hypothetical protein
MQLMPDTWSDMRFRYRLGNDPFDVHDNIFAGTAYLREMFDRYGYPGLFAAYHAGPGRLDAALAGLKPLPTATKIYLESIVPGAETGVISKGNRLPTSPISDSDALFFVRAGDEKPTSNGTGHSRPPRSVFVPLASELDSGTR